jgi:8-oxo-dGTP pyrophosphatase MutT (NUDIX family)
VRPISASAGVSGGGSDASDGFVLPRIPASAGGLIFDGSGRLLIVNPTYKKHWTIPGGIMEADGETPWEGCRREVREEVGLDVTQGRLVAVDFLRPRSKDAGGMRFLFDCGVMSDEELAGITLQEEELSEYRLAEVPEALEILSAPLRRRIGEALKAGPDECVYLEDGLPR